MRTTTAALRANIEALERQLDESRQREAATADELRARTRELKDALEQQAATAEILQVIGRSAFNLDAVLTTLASTAGRLCNSRRGGIFRREGDVLRLAANYGFESEPEYLKHEQQAEIRAGRGTLIGRVILEKRPVHIVDAWNDPEYEEKDVARLGSTRALFGVPLLRDGELIGAFGLGRNDPAPYTQREMHLVTTFADQAAIAMENVRLFDEVQARTRDLSEALQQQTATADVLKAISRSAFDLDTVLTTLISTAVRLCNAGPGQIFRRDGDVFRYAASQMTVDPAYRRHELKAEIRAGRGTLIGRVALEGRAVQISDAWSDPEYEEKNEARVGNVRAMLGVPLMRGTELIGAFALARSEPIAFSKREVQLVTGFADQAVIAIENVRLFDEVQARTRDLSDALEQQTATAEVLKVISRSAFDLQPVFDALLTSAITLSGADGGSICVRQGDVYPYTVVKSDNPDFNRFLLGKNQAPDRSMAAGRVLLSGRVEEIPDTSKDREYVAPSQGMTSGSILAVPLLREDCIEGVIVLGRHAAGPFAPRLIELVRTFADQAVIALQNARLFHEVQGRTRELEESLQQQTATADVLKVISRSAFDLQSVLDTLVESAARLCAADRAAINRRDRDVYRTLATHGYSNEMKQYFAAHPLPADRGSVTGRAGLARRPVHVPDVLVDPEYAAADVQGAAGFRTVLGLPLLRDGTAIGVFALLRNEVNPFTDKQIELVTTFADQAVIAIENARLFDEVQARTRDLSEALEQQTATADVLKVISRSAFDLDTVLTTLCTTAVRLCRADLGGEIFRRDGDVYRYAASQMDTAEAYRQHEQQAVIRAGRGTLIGRVALEKRAVQIADVRNDPEYEEKGAASLANIRTMLGVPLLRGGEPIGAFALGRSEQIPYTQREVELVTTFADQAVIAIENVRLFDEVRARTDELARSLDDLRSAQDRLIQTEKLASLGQLTAGIAHEIKNPLNFVNNFADLSRELIGELEDVIGASGARIDDAARTEIDELTGMLKSNLEKVAQHGRRADSIVKNMLLHSREGGGERRSVDLNAAVEEALNLAYHGARAEKPGFNVTLGKTFDPTVGSVEVFPQEFTRVLLNLISNGFYAAHRKKPDGGPAFEPTLTVSTKALPARVEIRVRDNGAGIPDAVKAKMFNPFFTTKPAGEGTGLGLSLSHDIIVKQHGGTLDVDTKLGEFTEFTIGLPRVAAARGKPEDRP